MSLTKVMAAGGILLLAVACSDSVLDPDTGATNGLSPTEIAAKRTAPESTRGPSNPGCDEALLYPGDGVYYPITDAATSRQGRNVKEVAYSAYNTEGQFVVEVTYGVTGPAGAEATITVAIDGVERVFEEVAPGTTVTYAVDLPAGWAACDEVAYSVRQEGLGRPMEFTGVYSLVPAVQPVLWNTLGSAAEVEDSEIGPGGTIVGAVNFNHDVEFGKGITPNTGSAGSGVDFPATVVDPERGTIELWMQAYDYPRPHSHGVYGFVNVSHWRPIPPLQFDWHNSGSQLQFRLEFHGVPVGVRFAGFHPALNVPVHLAAVWDRDGIDGTGDYMRIYVNGEVVAANADSNDWGTEFVPSVFRVATTWDRNFGTDRFSVDDLKVWDFAKTDFSDRFME